MIIPSENEIVRENEILEESFLISASPLVFESWAETGFIKIKISERITN